jgi:hypothetical protein
MFADAFREENAFRKRAHLFLLSPALLLRYRLEERPVHPVFQMRDAG